MMQVALYKGPPSIGDWVHVLSHWITCAVLSVRAGQWVRHSHAEIVIDGVCYSSSLRDGGTRAKQINLNTGRWDVLDVPVWFNEDAAKKIAKSLLGRKYDRRGALALAIPSLGQNDGKIFCFEFVAQCLQLDDPHTATPPDLIAAVVDNGSMWHDN